MQGRLIGGKPCQFASLLPFLVRAFKFNVAYVTDINCLKATLVFELTRLFLRFIIALGFLICKFVN